jgi:uncharacterized protein YceH (UPF0502 family)
MVFAFEQGLAAGDMREIARALHDLEALKKNLDGADPSLASLMRLFEHPSEALRERLEGRLLTRERRPYHLPQEDDDCDPGYFELERVITQLTWRYAEILAARTEQAALSGLRDAAAGQAAHIAALERQAARIAALEREIAAKDAIIMQQGCIEIPP